MRFWDLRVKAARRTLVKLTPECTSKGRGNTNKKWGKIIKLGTKWTGDGLSNIVKNVWCHSWTASQNGRASTGQTSTEWEINFDKNAPMAITLLFLHLLNNVKVNPRFKVSPIEVIHLTNQNQHFLYGSNEKCTTKAKNVGLQKNIVNSTG